MKKADKIRFLASAADSPSTFPGMYSPMTELSMNLNDASLASSPVPEFTPRRRLSLSSDGTPTPNRCNFLNAGSRGVAMDFSCDKENEGLLKSAIKFPGIRDTGFSRPAFRKMQPVVGSSGEDAPLDKENHRRDSVDVTTPTSVIAVTPSPVKPMPSPSKFMIMRHVSRESPRRAPLEDHDPNSQDSGYGNSQEAKVDPKTGFRFAEPFGLAPRRQLSDQSPRKENSMSPNRFLPPSPGSTYHSDGFSELFDSESNEPSEDMMPAGLGCLLVKPIRTEEPDAVVVRPMRPSFRRSFSLVDANTPNLCRPRSCLFPAADSSPMQLDEAPRAFKRPSAPSEDAAEAKRCRSRQVSIELHSVTETVTTITTPTSVESTKKQTVMLKRCYSETQATIMKALHRSTTEPDLIGDFTLPYILPLMDGRHQDLKTISVDTLAQLMDGMYSDSVESFTIVDCRYPYEFEGGHIRGARNVFTKEQVQQEFVDTVNARSHTDGAKRKHIIVFHCEFSSERGPNLYRFLRNIDRAHNKEVYPALFHPEMYLLDGGYKRFFESHAPLCEPSEYRPMLDPGHENDLRRFRAKSKSWTGDSKSRLALRSGLKRLGL